jgi:diamine N-acetyltransferase
MIRLRSSCPEDLAFVTTLERMAGNRDFIGQWSDAEHLAAMGSEVRSHWIIESPEGEPAGYLIAYDCVDAGCGIYVKRILVKDKGRGIGRAALARFVEDSFARTEVALVWLIVFERNARAQAVYHALGFQRFDPDAVEAVPFDAAAEPPREGAFRMILRRPSPAGKRGSPKPEWERIA